jgi:SAM-dependent methyltransferase
MMDVETPLAAPAPVRARAVGAFLADRGIDPTTLCLQIDPADEMLGFLWEAHGRDGERARFHYFQSGASIADALLQLLDWRFGRAAASRPLRLLDFASGYGRVTRFLVRALPPESIWVSDVYADAVRFQREHLGVHGAVSAVRPEELALEGPFDAVLVTSLFTHLPEESFVAWLSRLTGMLAPGGLLAFSVHGSSVLPMGEELPPSGIRFEAISESGSLDPQDYGSTWVSEAFVRRALDRAAGPGRFSLRTLPRGLNNFQDLCLAVPEPGCDFSGLDFQAEPQLFLEGCKLAGRDRLKLSGWAIVRGGEAKAVEAILDGELVARFPVADRRPEVAAMFGEPELALCGWGEECRLPEGADRGSILLLRVEDGRGKSHAVYGATLESALLQASELTVRVLEDQVRHQRELAALDAARAGHAREELAARLAAMEASRFWKIRNLWFRGKRALGLTGEP